MGGKTLKTAAKEAKSRLKDGFWQNHKEEVQNLVERARENGICATDVLAYYSKRSGAKLCFNDEESFYERVKEILQVEGEVGDMLGRLTDKDLYESLDYSAKQRYMLALSERYQRALVRYRNEKIFEQYC